MKKEICFLLILSVMLSCSSNKPKTIPCKDGSIAVINQSNPLSLYNEDLQKKIHLGLELKEIFKISPISVEKQKKIEQNVEQLNQVSSRYWISIIALYEEMKINPCDKELRLDYRRRIERMFEYSNQSEKRVENILKLATESGLSGSNYEIMLIQFEKLIMDAPS